MIFKSLSAMCLFLLGTTLVLAQAKTEKFEVKGSCGMCETRIEKAAKSVNGVSKADWNLETNILTAVFDTSKTNVNNIHMAIAKVGHDTPLYKAKDQVYNALPGCCKYDRTEGKTENPEIKH